MAKRSGFDGVFLDPATGNAISGIDWTVYESDGTTVATVYASKTANSPLPGTNTTSSTGVVQFWAEPGYYEVHIDDPSGAIAERRIPFSAVAGDDGGITRVQIDFGTGVTTGQIGAQAVETANIKDDAVTAPKINANAVLSDNIKFDFASGFGSFSTDGANTTGTCATLTGVLPGIYLAIGKYGSSSDTYSPEVTVTAGAATISQAGSVNNISNKMYGGGSAEYVYSHHVAMVEVTSTATLRLRVIRGASSGVVVGEMQLFGVLAA